MDESSIAPESLTAAPPEVAQAADLARPIPSDLDGPGLAIIPSKIRSGSSSENVLTRPRLVGWLEQQRGRRLVLLMAEAGFGKSTLLADYSSRTGATCVWYRLETSDGDWITYLSYLVAAMREAYPEFGRPTEALLRHVAAMGPSREIVVAQFLSDLDELSGREIVLILDDYQHVDGSEDVRVIMTRLLERAPQDMRFIVAGRARPNLALGRLAGQGKVSELGTSDLRFTRSEIAQLFETAYGQPLEEETIEIVTERTQGWAASLQLVSASIAASRPSEVTSFIDALSGASGPIYDFLAEEVLSRLSPVTQRVLLHASLIDRVAPELVAAALSVDLPPLGTADVAACLSDAETLGLIGRRQNDGAELQIHPLLRQFLAHHLHRETPSEVVAAMHRAIAHTAELTDWLVAGKHYSLAGDPDEAMRVLGSAASQALGTGAWGAAAEVVASMPDTIPPPAVEVIKARALLAVDRRNDAMELLAGIDIERLDGEGRGLVGLTTAAALHGEGDAESVQAEIRRIAQDSEVPSPLREVAAAWQLMLAANEGGSIASVVDTLDDLGAQLQRAGLHHFAGVTLHNNANAELARGNYRRAVELSNQAIVQLTKGGDAGQIVASTMSLSATCLAEMGRFPEAIMRMEASLAQGTSTADAIAEAAYLYAVTGDSDRAHLLLARLDRGGLPGAQELPALAQARYGRVALHIAQGDFDRASLLMQSGPAADKADVDAKSRMTTVLATLAALTHGDDFRRLASDALAASASQQAWRWSIRARILDAIASRNGEALALWVEEACRESALATLELADVIASSVGMLHRLPAALETSISQMPQRWMPALRRVVEDAADVNAYAAAELVARYGTLADSSVLRDFDRGAGGRTRRRGYATKLIRRVSATVRVHDLGPTNYEIANRRITLSETRRKAAALLLYLVSRPSLAASREQVMESLWPDQTPKSALNSLHQTLFFLRRDIEPWYEDGATADYVRMESDLVFLDAELFQVDSVAFARQCSSILAARNVLPQGPAMLRLYRGKFAPEFEYEEWTEDWRTQLHGTYLRLAHTVGESLMQERRWSDAVDMLTTVTTVDPMAFELRFMLVAALAATGATDAAHAHYISLAALHLRDLGVPARSYEETVRLDT